MPIGIVDFTILLSGESTDIDFCSLQYCNHETKRLTILLNQPLTILLEPYNIVKRYCNHETLDINNILTILLI